VPPAGAATLVLLPARGIRGLCERRGEADVSRPVDETETFADVLYESRTDNGPPDDGTDDDCDAEEEEGGEEC
jgi:hypothetical protein